MRFEETELLPQGDVSPQIWVWLDQRSRFYTQVLILLHFGTRLRMLKNFLCTLPPALPPPSYLLSTACQKNPTYVIFWWWGKFSLWKWNQPCTCRLENSLWPRARNNANTTSLQIGMQQLMNKIGSLLVNDKEAHWSWERMTAAIYWDLLHPLSYLILSITLGGRFCHRVHPTIKAQRD